MRGVRRRQVVLDAVLAAAVFAFTLGMLARGDFDRAQHDEIDALGAALAACAAWPLAARRLAPLPVFLVVTAATAALYGLEDPVGPPFGFAVALYTFAERREERRARTWQLALAFSVAVLLVPHAVRFDPPELLLGAVVWAASWFAGDRARLRRERLAELEERALRAEREAERERRLAAAEERTRIARDLHDSAGHAINVILVQAGAARLHHEQDPARSREAIETIEHVARGTLGEIEQLVRALREDGGTALEPPLGLAALDALAEQHRASGLDVAVSVDGEPRPLTPAVDQAAYRILQEALTNAARHGLGSAEVEIRYGEQAVEIAVANPAPLGAALRPGGHGIVGMRERASLLGGTIEAGASGGVFEVRARLPYEAK